MCVYLPLPYVPCFLFVLWFPLQDFWFISQWPGRLFASVHIYNDDIDPTWKWVSISDGQFQFRNWNWFRNWAFFSMHLEWNWNFPIPIPPVELIPELELNDAWNWIEMFQFHQFHCQYSKNKCQFICMINQSVTHSLQGIWNVIDINYRQTLDGLLIHVIYPHL